MVAPTTLPTVWWSLTLPLRFPPGSSPGAAASSGDRADISEQPRVVKGQQPGAAGATPNIRGVTKWGPGAVGGPIRRHPRVRAPARGAWFHASSRPGPRPARLPGHRRLLARGPGLVVGRRPTAAGPVPALHARDDVHPVEHLPPHPEPGRSHHARRRHAVA